ncbi:fused response regulator/phosphatase [Chrysiogenes arsenatis]|uniref:fused response regulator/phosphatase n=1 Tax=Chrysiogenes arsenatis TaxID=309797 RepID=UPI000410CF17|nr:fused response regulator/phosphatase [Chrysiogenes arsenatis]
MLNPSYADYHFSEDFFIESFSNQTQSTALLKSITPDTVLMVLTNTTSNHEQVVKLFDRFVSASNGEEFRISRFIEYVRENIRFHAHHDIPMLFAFFQQVRQTMLVANFGMPPVILHSEHGEPLILRQHEPKLGNYNAPFTLQVIPTDPLATIFLTNSTYLSQVMGEQKEIVFSRNQVLFRTNKEMLDAEQSISFFHLCLYGKQIDRIIVPPKSITLSLDAVNQAEIDFDNYLNQEKVPSVVSSTIALVFHEIILNAFEHGILAINADEGKKNALIMDGEYENFVHEAARSAIGTISYTLTRYRHNLMRITITDSGGGFCFHSYITRQLTQGVMSLHHRGIRMAIEMSDAIFYTRNGTQADLFFRLEDRCELPTAGLSAKSAIENNTLDLTLLYVEDDDMARKLYARILKRRIGTIYMATNGQEGLEMFHNTNPDIIITDVQMPKMNGLEMARHIREKNRTVPIILTTAFSDRDCFVDAIEIGINRFINKPVETPRLYEIIDYYAHIITTRKELERKITEEEARKQQEFFALQSQHAYMEAQQQTAFSKEQLIIRDDSEQLTTLSSTIFYEPRDILSGDIYGVIKADEDHQLFYIIDCMGKGLGASVTATLSAAFINRLDAVTISGCLDATVKEYFDYIKNYLLDDELVSFTMICVNARERRLRYASFGMYPLLIKDLSTGKIQEYRSNNPPLMVYYPTFKVSAIELPQSFSILIYSDGLCESPEFSSPELQHAFRTHNSLEAIIDTFTNATGMRLADGTFCKELQSDDLSAIYITSRE